MPIGVWDSINDNLGYREMEADYEAKDTLRSIIADIPDRTADLLVMYYIYGLTQEEISQSLGMSVSIISQTINGACEIIRRRFKENGEKTDE